MVSMLSVLQEVPDPRGRQGLLHPLHALLALMLLSMLCGRRGMMAAFRLGRGLTPRQLRRLGFRPGLASPCHATLTETLRSLDPDAMSRAFARLTADAAGDARHIAIDGKTLRGSGDAEGRAEHVLSAFCGAVEQTAGHTSSRGKGMEIPDALRLLDDLDLTGKIVTGDAMFCQKSIASKIVENGGDSILTVKGNQEELRGEIRLAFEKPVFPLAEWSEAPQLDHGRIDRRHIAILPAEALGEDIRREWPTIGCIARVTRVREPVGDGRIARRWRKGKGKGKETAWLIASLPPSDPQTILSLNRNHWRIEIMHRDRDRTLGEDLYTNRLEHAPRNIFTLLGATRTLLKRIATSPTRAIEMIQDHRNGALDILSGTKPDFH